MIKYFEELIPALSEFLHKILGNFHDFTVTVADIAIIFVISNFIFALIRKVTKRYFERKVKQTKNTSRYVTLSKLFDHIIVVTMWFIIIVAALSELNLVTTAYSMLATAGIGGIAIGLGAQSLIKDVINGGFMLVEQQISVGDYVKMADITGTVEDINMRTTRLRAFTGELIIIPNGQVSVVTNYSRGTNLAIVDVPMPYDKDDDDVIAILREAMAKYYNGHKETLDGEPTVLGVMEYASSAIMIRIVAKCKDLTHWSNERGIRAAVLDAFKDNDISIPYNTVVVMGHGEKNAKKS